MLPRSYRAPAAWVQVPAAHGGEEVTEVCECGATRRVNRNGVHREVGHWISERSIRAMLAGEADDA